MQYIALMPKKLRKHPHCLNCDAEIDDFNYCQNCGQINTTKQVSLRQILHDLLGDYFTFDSKFFRSFVPLLKSPGFLTNEYIAGRRTNYIFPLRLYIFTTVFFFFIITISGRIGKFGLEANRIARKSEMKQLFEKYDDAVPDYLQRTIVDDLSDNFRLTVKQVDSSTINYRDTLRAILSEHIPGLAVLQREHLLREMYNRIRFSKKGKKENDQNALALMGLIMTDFTLQNGGTSSSDLVAALDSQFRIRVREFQLDSDEIMDRSGRPNIQINGTPIDSLESGYMKSFGEKIEALISRGEEGGTLFWREVLNQMPKVMFLIMPLFALILKLLYIRQKIFYINHLIFSLHAHTVIFLYLLLALLFPVWYVITFAVLGVWWHLFFAMRNVYKQKWLMTILKLNSLLVLYFFPLTFGLIVLAVLAVVNV